MGIEFIIMPMVLSIPIVAILSTTFMKYQKLKHESGALSNADKEKVMLALEENQILKKRVENLEMIMSDPDVNKTNYLHEKEMQEQINLLAKEIKRLKQEN